MISYKILVVDDEIDNIKSINQCIFDSKEPYILYQALNGELAYKIAVAELPDLIISDWEMPGMTGIELIQKLKLNESTTEIPVIMCTGVMTSSENLQTALMAGAVDYIRKPIDQIELMARVKSMLMLSDSRKILKEKYQIIEQNNSFIHAVMESIPHPFVYYNLEGEIKKYNRRFDVLFGRSNDVFLNATIYDFFDVTNAEAHREQDKKLVNDMIDLSYETMVAGCNYIFTKTFLYNPHVGMKGIVCVMTDVSELKLAHDELIESKKRELTTGALRLIQLSELNNNLISDLEKITIHTDDDGTELIRQTISKFNLCSDENFWQEFGSRFENVYETFYLKLNQLFPQLTSGEKKLCAFLRLNLSSKDIAAITFKDPQSVDMARYRLRKKLNLKPDEKLIEFLMNIG
jgi:DNA-binding response OmpR family regulator/DNA-binding CsgD family transcriptional regulator